ncbi:hypothetical protein NLX86_16275 [Streptomyces sp. A3M-1-3]|uniref:hypothetical protein n=1 Tax=Streptomyces sp. A3M-1-3 TaxID=2962044 RepID=UPI0020B8B37C|nr:hypothetical protein [Streptomyces sp. A3M-1-3]MCP3819601.1 hypothetical protein [Streptomyces sp. A3M-1-3]
MSESEDSVEYVFGDDPAEMSRHLTMHVASRRSRPVDGDADYAFLKASRKINAMYEETERWPDRGMSVS